MYAGAYAELKLRRERYGEWGNGVAIISVLVAIQDIKTH
jgi:hypothetical protein